MPIWCQHLANILGSLAAWHVALPTNLPTLNLISTFTLLKFYSTVCLHNTERVNFLKWTTHGVSFSPPVTSITGASHASHLGCSLTYSSRVSYIKKRQVWKSQSETDWPHLRIMPGFATEKYHSILMLTSACWQEISLSNTVELTTVMLQKQKICCFKHCFLPVFENSRGSIVCLRTANPVTRPDWAVSFLRTSADCHTETGTHVKTKPPNHGTSRDLLHVGRQWNLWNFRKPAKSDA